MMLRYRLSELCNSEAAFRQGASLSAMKITFRVGGEAFILNAVQIICKDSREIIDACPTQV